MRKTIVSATMAVLASATVLLASPANAAPPGLQPSPDVGVMHASCGTGVSDKDGSSWNTTGYGANQRSGSSTSCAILGVAGAGDRLDYHCYTYGNDGYTWTYLRNDTDRTYGWVRDDLLGDNGSYVYCGF